MQIQVNSDHSVGIDKEMSETVEASVNMALERFDGQITRVEIHLSDVNGTRSSAREKRCLLEARPEGRDPVAVTNEAATLEEAVKGAAQKMQRMLSSLYGRLGETA